MNEMRRNFWLGLFVLTGLFALGALVVIFGQQATFSVSQAPYALTVRFDSVSGLRPGTMVTIGGLDVGRVQSLKFADSTAFDRGVDVLLTFNSRLTLHRGTRAETVEPGLGMGRPPVEIFPGPASEPLLEPGAVIEGRTSKMVESLIPPEIVTTFESTARQIGEASQALTPVLNDLHEMLQARTPAQVDSGQPGNFSSAAARLDTALKHLNEVIGDEGSQGKLKGAIDNIYAISEDGKTAASELKAAIGDARTFTQNADKLVTGAQGSVTLFNENLENVARKLTTGLEQASTLLTELNTTAVNINRGEGTIGKLMTDERLYESANFSFMRLTEAIEELKQLIRDFQSGKVPIRVSL